VTTPKNAALLALGPFATSRLVRHHVPRALRFVALPIVLSTAPAFAHEGALGGPAIEVPTPPPGDGLKAVEVLEEVAQKAQDPRSKKTIADAVAKAKKALERAHGARTSGDAAHARMLDGLALEWAETARDLLRAQAAEQTSAVTADKAREASVQADRARALLEETQARRGRADAELKKALAEEALARTTAAKAEETRIASGKDKPPGKDKPKKKTPKDGAKKGK